MTLMQMQTLSADYTYITYTYRRHITREHAYQENQSGTPNPALIPLKETEQQTRSGNNKNGLHQDRFGGWPD